MHKKDVWMRIILKNWIAKKRDVDTTDLSLLN